jgi:hypothetical protein
MQKQFQEAKHKAQLICAKMLNLESNLVNAKENNGTQLCPSDWQSRKMLAIFGTGRYTGKQALGNPDNKCIKFCNHNLMFYNKIKLCISFN